MQRPCRNEEYPTGYATASPSAAKAINNRGLTQDMNVPVSSDRGHLLSLEGPDN